MPLPARTSRSPWGRSASASSAAAESGSSCPSAPATGSTETATFFRSFPRNSPCSGEDRILSAMTQDAWPSPDAPSGPLPRIEDLPIAEQGYEQEAVRLAFDSFYRHAAQVDASLRALEAVEVFRRDADALRNDLRALRELGLSGSPDPAWPTLRYEEPRREAPMVVIRLAFEAALIIAVAVVAAVAHFRPVVVVGVMAVAFVIVAFSEWLGARSRFVSPAAGFAPAVG